MLKFVDCKEGEAVSGLVVLTDAQLRKTKQNKDYLSITVSDGTDKISGNIWDYKLEGSLPATGKVYLLQAVIGSYLGTKQLNNIRLTLQEDKDVSMFAQRYCTEEQANEVYSRIFAKIQGLSEPLRTIVTNVYMVYAEELKSATSAASNHHVGVYGNICHTLEVCEIAEAITTTYHVNAGTVPVSTDLVIAGALLHDIGKAVIYKMDGPKITYNLYGQLFDHIAQGAAMLRNANQLCPYHATLDLLEHIILSHHGEMEYGSPTTPAFIEAEIVCRADGISAALNSVLDSNRKALAEGKTFTDKIWTGRNRPWVLQKTVANMLMQDMEESDGRDT